jgi:predicted acyltransferase
LGEIRVFSTHRPVRLPIAFQAGVGSLPRAARLPAVDHFRGFAILMMAVMNHLLGVETLPAWLQHTPDAGLTVTDLGAPWFIFAIGLTYRLSFGRRAACSGRAHAYGHFVRRAAILFAFGFIMAYADTRLRRNLPGTGWSPLQAIAVAVLLTLPLITLPLRWRLIAGAVLLAGYQILLDRYWLPLALGSVHGGPPGALGWTAMLILSTVFADLAATPDRRKLYASALAVACAGGFALSAWVPISKARVSASYVLVSLAVSAALYALFYVLTERVGWRSAGLTAWGRNPLVLYLLLNVLLALLVLPDIPAWHAEAPFWLAAAQALVLAATLSRVAFWLDKRGMVISL